MENENKETKRSFRWNKRLQAHVSDEGDWLSFLQLPGACYLAHKLNYSETLHLSKQQNVEPPSHFSIQNFPIFIFNSSFLFYLGGTIQTLNKM